MLYWIYHGETFLKEIQTHTAAIRFVEDYIATRRFSRLFELNVYVSTDRRDGTLHTVHELGGKIVFKKVEIKRPTTIRWVKEGF